jgi:hypothetical protein
MKHAFVYHGAFERNFESLKPGAATFIGATGRPPAVPIATSPADGLLIGYMERAGKKFVAVRVRFENRDIVLSNPVPLDHLRHLGGKRFSPKPVLVSDDLVSTLMDDVLAANPAQEPELALLLNRINQVRRGDRNSIE